MSVNILLFGRLLALELLAYFDNLEPSVQASFNGPETEIANLKACCQVLAGECNVGYLHRQLGRIQGIAIAKGWLDIEKENQIERKVQRTIDTINKVLKVEPSKLASGKESG